MGLNKCSFEEALAVKTQREIAFVSGKYANEDPIKTGYNILGAKDVARSLWGLGYAVICPHTNTGGFEVFEDSLSNDYRYYEKFSWKHFMRGYLTLLEKCDLVVMVPGWEKSEGSCMEREYAMKIGIPVYEFAEVGYAKAFETESD